MSGFFYPHTLSAYWYKEDICFSIHKSLENMKNYLAPTKENRERRAYLKTYEECQQLCKQLKMDPSAMITALILFKNDLEHQPKPWVLSLDNWLYETQKYREQAVADCISIVKANTRYLP